MLSKSLQNAEWHERSLGLSSLDSMKTPLGRCMYWSPRRPLLYARSLSVPGQTKSSFRAAAFWGFGFPGAHVAKGLPRQTLYGTPDEAPVSCLHVFFHSQGKCRKSHLSGKALYRGVLHFVPCFRTLSLKNYFLLYVHRTKYLIVMFLTLYKVKDNHKTSVLFIRQ